MFPALIALHGSTMKESGTEDKNKGMIINTDAGNCQTFSWHFRASLAQADKLCYFSFFFS